MTRAGLFRFVALGLGIWLVSACAGAAARRTVVVEEGEHRPSGPAERLLQEGIQKLDHAEPTAAVTLLEQAVALFRQAGDRAGEARASKELGNACYGVGEYRKAIEAAGVTRTLAREVLQDPDLEARALNNMGMALQALERHDQALRAYQDSLALSRQERDFKLQGMTLANLARMSLERGEYGKAIERLQEMLAAVRRADYPEGEAWALVHLGQAYAGTGNEPLAIASYGDAAALARKLDNPAGQAAALDGKAFELYKSGDLTASAAVARQVLSLAKQIERPQSAAAALRILMLIHLTRSELRELVSVALQARETARQIPDAELEEAAVGHLSRAHASLGKEKEAADFYRELLELAGKSINFKDAAEALDFLGGFASRHDDHAAAAERFEQLVEVARKIPDRTLEGKALASLGEEYDALGRGDAALDALRQGITIAREVGDLLGEAMALRKLGLALLKRGDVLDGIDLLDQGLTRTEEVIAEWERQGVIQGQEEVHASLREGLQVLGSHLLSVAALVFAGPESGTPPPLSPPSSSGGAIEGVRQIMERTLERARRENDRASEAKVLASLARLATNRGDAAAAAATAGEALAAARASHQEEAEAAALLVLATVSQEPDQAILYGREGLALAEKRNDRAGQAVLLAGLGASLLAKRDLPDAVETSEKAVALARELQIPDVELFAVQVLGTASGLRLDNDGVIRWSAEALRLARSTNDRHAEAEAHRNLGTAYQDQGDYLRAIQHCRLATGPGDPGRVTFALECLAGSYMALGDLARAGENARRAVESAQESGDTGLLLPAQGIEAQQLVLAGDFPKAADRYRRLAGLWAESKEPFAGAMVEVLQGSAKALSQDPQGAVVHLERASRLLEAADGSEPDPFREELRLGVSSMLVSQYLACGKSEQALAHARQAAEKSAIPERRAARLNDLGHALFASGQLAAAEEILRQAVAEWEKSRARLGPEARLERTTALDVQELTYELLQEVLVARGKAEEALEYAERGRARALVEVLASRGQSPASPLGADTIRRIAREKNVTLVEYSILYDQLGILLPSRVQGTQPGLEKRLLIWVVRPTGEITLRTVDLADFRAREQVSLASLVLDFRDSIPRGGRGVVLPPQILDKGWLRRLHRLLIVPIADLLPRESEGRVVFIPQGPLFLVPFAALEDATGRFLVEKHTILAAPSIESLTAIQPERGKPLWAAGDALVVGNPRVASELELMLEAKLPDLLGAATEAEAIAREFQVEPLLGEKATREAVLRLLPERRFIHLATHGFAERLGDPDIPGALALSPSKDDDGLLTAREILDLRLRADLAVLSSCDTGKGRITSDGLVGLSRSFIEAGASNVVVSLWSIDDPSTSRLMTDFYRRLRGGAGVAEALSQAMRQSIHAKDVPEHWGAFLLMGGLG